MNNEKKADNLMLTTYRYPGVFKVECIPEKRAYFGEALNFLLDARKVVYELQDGTFENQQLLQDFKKYGVEGLYISIVVGGSEYYDEEKRKAALDAAKKAWQGELY